MYIIAMITPIIRVLANNLCPVKTEEDFSTFAYDGDDNIIDLTDQGDHRF